MIITKKYEKHNHDDVKNNLLNSIYFSLHAKSGFDKKYYNICDNINLKIL